MEEGEDGTGKEKKKKGIIEIPSYQDVYNNTSSFSSSSSHKPYNPPPPLPPSSSSFSQAFSFIKSSEFYTPPPPPPPPVDLPPRPADESQPSSAAPPATPASASSASQPSGQNRNAILVSHRQKGNPLLKHIRNVRLEECGRYLETIKVYENKPADSIREHTDTDYLSRLTHALTTVRHVNKTDVITLGSAFGSLSRIMDASMEDLARCPGIGERKVKRLYDTFHEPFRRVSSRPAVAATEAPIKGKNVEEPPSTEDGSAVEGKSSDPVGGEKKSNPDVRSALTAAFAKYADRARKAEQKSSVVERGSTSTASKDA